MVILYTAIRLLMAQAAQTTGADPRDLSFLETLHHLIEAAPLLTLHDEARSSYFCILWRFSCRGSGSLPASSKSLSHDFRENARPMSWSFAI